MAQGQRSNAVVRGRIPHIEWLDLNGDGTIQECAVVKKNKKTGDVHFIKIDELDGVDKRRLHQILVGRNAGNFELWDLLSQHVLGNGMNALEYFHQLVKVKAPSGTIYTPNLSRIGVKESFTERPTQTKVSKKEQA